jgi:hypothetical protein
MWIYAGSKPIFKHLIRPILEVHFVLSPRRLSSRHACLNSPLIPGNSSPSCARRYLRGTKFQLDFFKPAAKENVIRSQQLPVSSAQKHLTTSTITQHGNQALLGKVVGQMTIHEPNEKDGRHRAFIALGSNMGDRLEMIERACRLLEHSREVSILRTSSLWETKAMYIENQADFLNGVCEVETPFQICIMV